MTYDVFAALSPAAADFLRQIADASCEGSPTYGYAQAVMLPTTGWSEEDFLPFLARDLSLPQNERALSRAMAAVRAGAFAPFSFFLTATSGDQVHFLALPRPGTDGEGKPRTVTSLAAQPGPVAAPARRVLDPIGRGSPVFKLLDVLPAYVLLIDKEYVIRYSNRIARQLFGKIEGKACHRTLCDTETPCAQCVPFRLFTDNAIKVHDWVNTRANAAFRAHSYPFEGADGARYVLQIGINITAGVRARSALDLSEQRYRSIADNLTIGLALLDPKLQAITLNPKMEEWFGSSAVKGAPIADLLQNTCCDGGDGPALLFAKLLTYGENQEEDFRLALHTGEERLFRVMVCPILSRTRTLRAIVAMLEDVTDRRHLASRMQRIQRLEALGSLAGGIAHEINQPLSALQLYASGMQMLLEQAPDTPAERIQERLSLILTQTEKIRLIIDHMRALVMQEENPPLTAVSVEEAITGAMGLVGTQLHDHGIKVGTDVPAFLPRVAANAMQLEQVVINLLVNAMHALDTVESGDKSIRITVESPGGKSVILRVIDNGPGLGKLHQRVFDPFFSTKGPNRGMGLGLSIVHAFVSSWNGSVEAVDNVDSGATFSVSLPVAGE